MEGNIEGDSVRPALEVHPLTIERWPDFEQLFGEKGGHGGCWCMWWRVPNKEYTAGEGNKQAMRTQVEDGAMPGLLGYREGQPVGWISVGPRHDYRRFPSMAKKTFAPVDAAPVWSIVCFFVEATQRRTGIARALLDGAIAYARSRGVATLEAYPVDTGRRETPVHVFMGTRTLFAQAGFQEVARREPHRPILRLELVAL